MKNFVFIIVIIISIFCSWILGGNLLNFLDVFYSYEMLAQFFDSLDSSIRLLRLKGSMSTFTNICPKIECLTDRYLVLHCGSS